MNYFDVLLAKKLEDTRDPVVKGLSVTENGRYSEENTVYDVVIVDVPETRLTTLNATANGTYTPQEGEAYNEVNVDVPLPSNAYLLKSLTGLPQDIATFTDGADAPLNALTASIESSCAGADIIVSESEIINNKTPYLFRKSAGGDRVYEKLIGGTVAWNQLVQNGNFADTSGWSGRYSNVSVSNHVITVTPTSAGTQRGLTATDISNATIYGHRYLIVVDVMPSKNVTMQLSWGGRYSDSIRTVSATQNVWTTCATMWTLAQGATSTTRLYALAEESLETSDTLQFRNAYGIDLTQLFGSTIADYIYSLEQATAGAGVAYFRQMFPNDYYAYDSGTLQSVNVASKKVYDSNNTLVATYTFDSDLTLRGIPKLDANNNLYYDGDVYESDGSVTRKYGIVDLGTLDYERDTSYDNPFFYAIIDGIGRVSPIKPKINIFCSEKYLVVDSTSMNSFGASADNNTICKEIGAARKKILIRDDSYTDAQAFKTAMSGIYLVYELATPTTESADAYINPQMVDADGTEEFVDYAQSQGTRDVAVPVGHDSYYYDGTLYSRDFPATISSGSYDIINGVITSGQNTYNTTPLPLRSLVGNNNIYVDCGEITNLEYFTKEQHE